MTTKLSLRDSHARFLCMRLLQRGGGREGGGGVEDWVTPKGRSDEGVPPGVFETFHYTTLFKGKTHQSCGKSASLLLILGYPDRIFITVYIYI